MVEAQHMLSPEQLQKLEGEEVLFSASPVNRLSTAGAPEQCVLVLTQSRVFVFVDNVVRRRHNTARTIALIVSATSCEMVLQIDQTKDLRVGGLVMDQVTTFLQRLQEVADPAKTVRVYEVQESDLSCF